MHPHTFFGHPCIRTPFFEHPCIPNPFAISTQSVNYIHPFVWEAMPFIDTIVCSSRRFFKDVMCALFWPLAVHLQELPAACRSQPMHLEVWAFRMKVVLKFGLNKRWSSSVSAWRLTWWLRGLDSSALHVLKASCP